jgi:hypothetical protein
MFNTTVKFRTTSFENFLVLIRDLKSLIKSYERSIIEELPVFEILDYATLDDIILIFINVKSCGGVPT